MADRISDIPTCSIKDFMNTSFDYIVCGGGTAGCTIAARLSENPNVTVGLIEAGKNRLGDPVVDIPAMFKEQLLNPDYDWCIFSEPQEGNRHKIHHIPRGKYLGGCSGMNAMLYVRGSLQDYDDWASLIGDDGWAAASMLSYMRKHQTFEPADADLNRSIKYHEDFHGTDGPIHTSFNEAALPIEFDFLNACEETTGITKKAIDPWSGNHLGIHHMLGTVTRKGPNKGKRSYSARGYVAPNHARPNLKVLCETRVNKVLIDEDNKIIGLSITHDGNEHEVAVAREVILSAGAVSSPQILELSGIGDPAILETAGVPCKVENAAIGANLQDHAMSFVNWEVKPDVMTGDVMRLDPEALPAAIKQYDETQDGPLAAIMNIMGFYSAKSLLSNSELQNVIQSIEEIKPTTDFHAKQLKQVIANLNDENSSNVQVVLLPALMNPEGDTKHQGKLFLAADPEKSGVMAIVAIQNPVSRGYIHIQSSDPAKQPIIQPNWLGHEVDATILAAGLRLLDRVGMSKHLRPSISSRLFPRTDVDLQNLSQAKDAAHDMVSSTYHLCGTAALGQAVDSSLRVKGVQGIRVADASIFPNNVSGNIQATVYAVAEKAADLIKEDFVMKKRQTMILRA